MFVNIIHVILVTNIVVVLGCLHLIFPFQTLRTEDFVLIILIIFVMYVNNLVHKTSEKIFPGDSKLRTSIISAVNFATKIKHGHLMYAALFAIRG